MSATLHHVSKRLNVQLPRVSWTLARGQVERKDTEEVLYAKVRSESLNREYIALTQEKARCGRLTRLSCTDVVHAAPTHQPSVQQMEKLRPVAPNTGEYHHTECVSYLNGNGRNRAVSP